MTRPCCQQSLDVCITNSVQGAHLSTSIQHFVEIVERVLRKATNSYASES